jgi:hypothetical protein
MARTRWFVAAALAAAAAAAPGSPGNCQAALGQPDPGALSNEIPKGVDWVNDWDKALATAAERGCPVLISFANDD